MNYLTKIRMLHACNKLKNAKKLHVIDVRMRREEFYVVCS